MKTIDVSVLDDQAFLAAGVGPFVKHMVFDVQKLGKTFAIPCAAAARKGVDDLKLLSRRIGDDAVSKAVRHLPSAGVDHHFTVDKSPENDSLCSFVIGTVVLYFHQEVGIKF